MKYIFSVVKQEHLDELLTDLLLDDKEIKLMKRKGIYVIDKQNASQNTLYAINDIKATTCYAFFSETDESVLFSDKPDKQTGLTVSFPKDNEIEVHRKQNVTDKKILTTDEFNRVQIKNKRKGIVIKLKTMQKLSKELSEIESKEIVDTLSKLNSMELFAKEDKHNLLSKLSFLPPYFLNIANNSDRLLIMIERLI